MALETKHRPDLNPIAAAPSFYSGKDSGIEKKFLAKLSKHIPHCDHIPSGIFHSPPRPNISFSVEFRSLNFEDLNAKLAKVFRRLRGSCQWLVKYVYSSEIVWIDLKEWDVTGGASAWGKYAPDNGDFENYYIVAEDFSFGMIAAVHGSQLIFFGKPLLEMINNNRALWPTFWKKVK